MRYDENVLHLQVENTRYRHSSQLVVTLDGQLRLVNRFHQTTRIKIPGPQLEQLLALNRELFREEIEISYPGTNQDGNDYLLTVRNPYSSGQSKKIHAAAGGALPEELTRVIALLEQITGKPF